MNRLILGTAPLGSIVSQSTSVKIIEAAYAAGFRRFDTAPQYGAGYASKVLKEALFFKQDVLISTKFGSAREPCMRYL